ncbi:MAG: acyltransferase family protein [Lachnospiraceae bacterium]|nr:acyltransferase family protein [Lachnospiraceae bacterium]
MPQRKYSIDFLKITATVFILLHHYQQLIGGVFPVGINFYGGRFNFGLMVEMLFTLSGFVVFPYIAKIYSGLTLKEFMTKRIKRLLPVIAITAVAYQACALLYYALFRHMEWFFDTTQLWDLVVASIGMQRGWVFTDIIYVNYPVWYISVLLLCYLIFWIGTNICARLHTSSRYFCVFMILFGISINSLGLDLPFMSDYTARGYISFFVGVLMGTYFYEPKVEKKTGITALLTVSALSVIYALRPESLENGFNYILSFLFYPSIIILFMTEPVKKLLRHMIWGYLSEVTFNSFMWHYTSFILLLAFMAKVSEDTVWCSRVGMIIWLVIILIAGAVSERLFSKINKNRKN